MTVRANPLSFINSALVFALLALAIACGDDAVGDAARDAAADTAGDAMGDAAVGSCSALAPVTLVADPGNGPARLGDADSDGNGISDVDEWGPIL